ncbi:hypothetical protein [Streptomyces durbertensis]|nr:hypothetical protein [Streptomyces durbertensis]
MRDFFRLCIRALREFCYGIDSAHAIRHGLTPAPRPTAQRRG